VPRFGRLLGLILAVAGFAAARAFVPAGHAMEVPVPTATVTTPSLPAPLPPPPTVTIAPTVSTPTVTTPPAPTPPPVTTAFPPAPAPPPVQIAPVPTPRVAPPPTTTGVAPPSVPPVGTATSSTGSTGSGGSTRSGGSTGSGSTSAPAGAAAPTQSSGRASSSSPGSAESGSAVGASSTAGGRAVGRPSSTASAQTLRAKTHRTKSRISVRLRFALPAAGRLFLVVRGPAPSCRVAGVVPLRAKKGTNTVFFAGRVQGHRLTPGLYQLSLSASRRPQPAAPATTVRVVSPRRSVPVTNPTPTPACTPEQAYFDHGTRRVLVAEAQQQQVRQLQPLGPIVTLAGAATAPLRPPLHPAGIANGDDEGIAGLLPGPGGSGGLLESFAAIGVLLIVASLLLGMVALVTRFLRGSWNP
jgi:hypothetical protein